MGMKKIILATALALAFSGSAQAAILLGSSDAANGFVKIAAPAGITLGNNSFQTNTLFGFDELQGITLAAALIIGNDNPVNPLVAGTKVNSHLIFFNPARNTLVRGSFTFNGKVLGVITRSARLAETNILFGALGVTYLSPNNFGLENNDLIFVSENLLDIRFNGSNVGDHIRVLTAVPEPAAWAMMIGGFAMVGGMMRRRRTTMRVTYA